MHLYQLDPTSATALQSLRRAGDADGTLGSPSELTRSTTFEVIAAHLRPPCDTIGIFVGEHLAGSATLSPVPRCELDPDSSIWFGISWVFVLPDFRRNGFARALVLECISRVEKLGGDGVLLEVNVPNPARVLYESLGFEAWNVYENAYQHNGQTFAQVSMRKFMKSN